MAQATRKKDPALPLLTRELPRRLREGGLFLVGTATVVMLIALFTYHAEDPSWSHAAESDTAVHNAAGLAGAWFSDAFLYLFGYMALVFPLMFAYAGWIVLHREGDAEPDRRGLLLRAAGFVLLLASGSGLASLHFLNPQMAMPLSAGGVLGDGVAALGATGLGVLGGTLLLLAGFVAGITWFIGLSWLALMDWIGEAVTGSASALLAAFERLRDARAGAKAREERAEVQAADRKKREKREKPRIEPQLTEIETSDRAEREKQAPLFTAAETGQGELPQLALLDEADSKGPAYSKAALEALSRQVELKLQDFGIETQVVEVHPGPVITRFELQPSAGTKVGQISALTKDLARALSVSSVRIVEVIPGKNTIGLETPNEQRETVRLREILESKAYDQAGSPLTLALGKDIGGQPVVADLAKMPHLLVAGTTGSGKSVAINAMLLSLLYKSTPAEVRLILVDPKMLELSVYEGIPHLLAPVVTDMKEAANALRWCCVEMDRRYRLMAGVGVRNLAGFNRKVAEAAEAGKPLTDPGWKPHPVEGGAAPVLEHLPNIVVIIDELADMMMVVGKKVEELIARLAQKARAAGIHLILATQRPSVDVITGLIKANIPTRIAFQVSSKIDSRTILDQMGAETLLGHGDMLYLPPGTGLPTRVHGAFVSDQEVHRVVEQQRAAGKPSYLEDVLRDGGEDGGGLPGAPGGDGEGGGEADPLYDQAVRIVTESRRASISAVQRRLKIGYNRAARMVEEMERAGIVGPLQSNGSREVLAPPPPEM